MIAAETAKIAAAFWQDAMVSRVRPRPIERAVAWALPVAIIGIPRLGFAGARRWLLQRGIEDVEDGADRSLRGCLVASRGHGVIFVDASDPDDERRFSIAHEIAHFILDYDRPRREVIATLGIKAADVLDGIREPTLEEKFSAVLRGVPLGSFHHLMVRGPRGVVAQHVLEAEDRADELALELLAPKAEVVRLARKDAQRLDADAIHKVLTDDFGLPDTPARAHAEQLAARSRRPTSVRKWLGL